MAYHADLFYQEALTAYDVAADLDPANWRWWYYSALVHLERGDAAAASDALRAVVAAQPDFGLAWWRLGESAFKQAKYDEAEMAYTRAASLRHPLAMRRSSLHLRGSVRRALRSIAEMPRLPSGFSRPLSRSGLVSASSIACLRMVTVLWVDGDGGRDNARAATLRAYAPPRDPLVEALADRSHSSVFLLRHAASLDLVDSARREQLVRRAVEVDPDNPDVVSELSSLLQQLGRPADAMPYLHGTSDGSRRPPVADPVWQMLQRPRSP